MNSIKTICVLLTMVNFLFLNNNLVAQGLKYSTPEAQGISSTDILAFVEAAEEQIDALHSFILLRHDNVVAQGWWNPYNPESPHTLASLSKSFTSTAIGMAVDEGMLTINDLVISFFPDETPEAPTANLKGMRIKDLLTMNTGHVQKEVNGLRPKDGTNRVAHFLSQPITHKPGTHFVYNSSATYMLSAILQKVSGKTLIEFLQPRLFGPLGIKDATWDSCPDGINYGSTGLYVKTEDIAKLGLFYLNKGIWNGKRLLSEAWIDKATSLQTSTGSDPDSDWSQGYGYQFWRNRHNMYRGDGAAGQYCIVMPDQDAVLAITASVSDMQFVLDLVWEYLLPAMKKAPLEVDNKGLSKLTKKLESLALKKFKGERSSEIVKDISGKVYACDDNKIGIEKVVLSQKGDGFQLTIFNQQGEHLIDCGNGKWEKGVTTFYYKDNKMRPIASSGVWTTPQTYMVNLCYYETSSVQTIEMRFEGGDLMMDLKMNNSRSFQIKGRAEK